jgi:hypothetical protein
MRGRAQKASHQAIGAGVGLCVVDLLLCAGAVSLGVEPLGTCSLIERLPTVPLIR